MKKQLLTAVLILPLLLIGVLSCKKNNASENFQTAGLSDKIKSLGFKQIEKDQFPVNSKFIEIKNETELIAFLNKATLKKFNTVEYGDRSLAEKYKDELGKVNEQTKKPFEILRKLKTFGEETGGSGSSFGGGLNGSFVYNKAFTFDNTYPWCNVTAEIRWTKNTGGQPNGEIVNVSATAGVGGFNLGSGAAAGHSSNTVYFSFSGTLYCGFTYNGIYYGNSGVYSYTGVVSADGSTGYANQSGPY